MYPAAVGSSPGASRSAAAGLPSDAVSERVGRYDLVRRLGSGGMAEVHLARASGIEGFEKLVVLKRILPHLSADPHFVKMFLAEARLAAILEHNNIVQVFDLGRHDQDYFFTMEFVYGETLYSVLRAARRMGQKLPLEHSITMGIGTAAGLHYAHERVGFDGKPLGIVHRDVSPSNVMLTYDGCVKVTDFGIAKVTSRTDVTQAGTRKGKVPYMSPEQCRAKDLDRRSDIFALGIVLYEASTQTRLFDGEDEFGVMNRIVNGDIEPPSSRRSGYPKELERIVMKALSVDRERRYKTARGLQLDLEKFAREKKLTATPSHLSKWMHDTFRPQPFPWGALVGDGGASPHAALSTLAEKGQALGSASGSAGRIPRSEPERTPYTNGGASWNASSAGSLGSAPHSYQTSGTRGGPKNTTLRGVAIGLGAVAGVAVAGLLGMLLQSKLSADDSGTDTPAAESPAAPAGAVNEPAGDAAPPAEAADDKPAESPPAAEVPPLAADDETPPEAEPPAEAEPDPSEDEELVVLEDERPASSGRRGTSSRGKRGTKPKGGGSSSKPAAGSSGTEKKKTGKSNLDAFLPQ